MHVKLAELFSPEAIRLRLVTGDRGVLRELSELLALRVHRPAQEICEQLIEREAKGSTALGDGVALPHCKLEGVERTAACLALSPAGIEFGAADGLPTRIFVGLISPLHADGAHLQALARVASLLKSPHVRNELLRATSQAGIYDLLREEERAHDAARGLLR